MSHTLAEGVRALRVRLDEPLEGQWHDIDLRMWIDEGIRDIARQTRTYTDMLSFNTTASVGEFIINDRILAIEHALWKGSGDTAKVVLEARAFAGVNRYINETGNSPVFFSTYGHPPTLRMQLFPTPTRAGVMYIYGPMIPAALDITGGTGNIGVAEVWYEAALDYAEYMAQRKDKDATSWKDTFQVYQSKVDKMIELSNTDGASGEFVFTGASMIPRWLSDFDWE